MLGERWAAQQGEPPGAGRENAPFLHGGGLRGALTRWPGTGPSGWVCPVSQAISRITRAFRDP